jgi:glyoxylase-like metal-dependent hydrolase (beta-lactamase superfamily II)
MCTHLHVDHVGWNTKLQNGRWVPTFPNARYLFGKTEYAHWESERGRQGEGKVNDGSFDDSVLPVVEAGKAVMIESDHQPDPLLTIKDYPGHTPGSIAINLRDGGRQACFSGDIMHHPIQVYHPDWSSQFCWNQAMSARSRRQLLEDCAETNALLCPAHFPGANAGYIKAAGDSFRIEWDVPGTSGP